MKLPFNNNLLVSLNYIPELESFGESCKENGLFIYRGVNFCPENALVYNKDVIRYLDRFYIILPQDFNKQNELWKKLYGIIGEYYEQLIDVNNNIACIKKMLEIIKKSISLNQESRILDYGCGSGLSGLLGSSLAIIGYEPAMEMRRQAKLRNMHVLGTAEFAGLPDNFFDAGFANYVFHMGIDEKSLFELIGKMREKSVFVANFYKNMNEKRVTACFESAGFHSALVSSEEKGFKDFYVYSRECFYRGKSSC